MKTETKLKKKSSGIIVLLMTIALMFALAACGGKDTRQPEDIEWSDEEIENAFESLERMENAEGTGGGRICW